MTKGIRNAATALALALALGLALPTTAIAEGALPDGQPVAAPAEAPDGVPSEEAAEPDPQSEPHPDLAPAPAAEPQPEQMPEDAPDSGEPAANPEPEPTGESGGQVSPDGEAVDAGLPSGEPDEGAAGEAPAGAEPEDPEAQAEPDAEPPVLRAAPALTAPAPDPEPEAPEPGWGTTDDGGVCYRDESGEPLLGLQKIDGHLYYFDPKTGAALDGWQDVGGRTYYFHPSTHRAAVYRNTLPDRDGKGGRHLYYFNGAGQMHTGWVTWNDDGTRSFFAQNSNYVPTGAAFEGWVTTGGKWYYFWRPSEATSSRPAYRTARYRNTLTGRDGGEHLYYLNGAGAMQTGLIAWADGTRSYFDADKTLKTYGAAVSGWQDVGGRTYYFDPEAEYMTAVRYRNTLPDRDGKGGRHLYYFNGAGQMHTGWVTWNDDGTRSFFAQNSNYVPTGAAFEGWVTTGGKWYYFWRPSEATSSRPAYRTARYRNTLTGRDGKKHDYYFNGAGAMQIGIVKFGSVPALYGQDGARVQSGWATVGVDKYYVLDGVSVQGRQTIDGKEYYFDDAYKMQTGWIYFSSDDVWNYYDKNGVKGEGPLGWTVSNGNYVYHGADGSTAKWNKSMYEAWKRISGMTSGTKYIVSVDRDDCYTCVFTRVNGEWVPYRLMRCTVGKGSKTKLGTTTMPGDRYFRGVNEAQTHHQYYLTQFRQGDIGESFFHSILYAGTTGTSKIDDGRLGVHASAGCVRLAYSDAEWVYKNLKKGTKCHIFSIKAEKK